MDTGSWIDFAVVLAVPLLVASRVGRGWLVGDRYRDYVWTVLATLAVVGTVSSLVVVSIPVPPRVAVVIVTPVLQALVFVALDRLFLVCVGRAPVSFSEARWGRPMSRYWVDKSFWLFAFIGVIGGGVILCSYFDVDFPA
jgi:xanthosine utilization system XapX-like protein